MNHQRSDRAVPTMILLTLSFLYLFQLDCVSSLALTFTPSSFRVIVDFSDSTIPESSVEIAENLIVAGVDSFILSSRDQGSPIAISKAESCIFRL